MTEEQRKEQLEILDRTNMHKKMNAERVVPEEYKAYEDKVERSELTIESPSSGVPVRCVITKAKERSDKAPVFINLHGGGFIHPQDSDDDMFCARVAAEIKGITVDVDYGCTPQYVFPVAFQQSFDVTVWVFEHLEELGADGERISVGGHSAGGALTAAICMKTAKEGNIKLYKQILDYAAIDNYMAMEEGGAERSRAFSTLYSDGNIDVLKDPYCSPYFAADEMLKNLPDTLVINALKCPFCEKNEEFGRRMAHMGNNVTLRTFTESVHGFTVRLQGEWQEAQKLIIEFLKR